MLDIDVLRNFGANVDEGIARCMGKEDFYLMLVGKVLDDKRLTVLEQQLAEKAQQAAVRNRKAYCRTYKDENRFRCACGIRKP